MEAKDFILNLIKRININKSSDSIQFIESGFKTRFPLITIEGIYSLLEDEYAIDKFIHFEENKDFFGNLSQKDVAIAIMQYVELMRCQGVEFSVDEKNRIKTIEACIPIYQRGIYIRCKEYDGIDPKEIHDVAMGVLCSKKELDDFLKCEQSESLYHDISPQIIEEYIIESLRKVIERISFSEQSYKTLNFFLMKKNCFLEPSYRVNPEKKLDPEFEKSVLQSINRDNDSENLALDIYNGLNKRVEYNNLAILSQDFSQQPAKDVYYAEFDKTNLENNKVTCKQWAELYAYFLEKNGFTAYVCGFSYHKKVVAIKGTTIIEADASTTLSSKYDASFLKDITRSKIGVRPAGFKAHTFDGDSEAIMSIDPMRRDYHDDIDSFENEIDSVKTLLAKLEEEGEICLPKTMINIGATSNKLTSAMKKLIFISGMMRKSNMGNADAIDYASNLYQIVLTDEEKEIVKMTNIFYQYVNTNNCERVPIFSIKIGDSISDSSKEKYLHFIFEQGNYSLMPISSDELKEKVARGIYIQGVRQRNKTVPGIPEITDPDWVVRNRANYTLANGKKVPQENELTEVGGNI